MDRIELRLAALQHATHDLRGNASAEDVVERAAEYLAFLEGAPAKGAVGSAGAPDPRVLMTREQYADYLQNPAIAPAVFP